MPETQFWEAVGDARKPAYEATSYDPAYPGRSARMRELTLALIVAYQRNETNDDRLCAWRKEAEDIRDSFYTGERVR